MKPETAIAIALRTDVSVKHMIWIEKRQAQQQAKVTAESIGYKIASMTEIVEQFKAPHGSDEWAETFAVWAKLQGTLTYLTTMKQQAEQRVRTLTDEVKWAEREVEMAEDEAAAHDQGAQ